MKSEKKKWTYKRRQLKWCLREGQVGVEIKKKNWTFYNGLTDIHQYCEPSANIQNGAHCYNGHAAGECMSIGTTNAILE